MPRQYDSVIIPNSFRRQKPRGLQSPHQGHQMLRIIKLKIFIYFCGGKWRKVEEKCVSLPQGIFKLEHMRFLGNIEAKVDAKGRSFLPAVFRKVLQASGEESLVMRMDPHQKCIVLYPESVWDAEMDTMESRLERWNRAEQQIYRQFVSMAELVTLDGNGRFLVPKRYLQMAGIGQQVRFIGVRNTIEMWNLEELESQFIEPKAFSELFGKMMSEDNTNTSE